MMGLQDEIDAQRKQIKADGYPISIGELVSMYRDNDLDIHPAFQRFFRWNPEQKSRWIESILLGIPTPSVFVSQRADGVWDVVDGLQRLSTILEFMGLLKDRKGGLLEPLTLQGTKYLPSLEGKRWEVGSNALTEDQRRFFKREKIEVKIVKRESDQSTKFELFQRLNTGGSSLSDQELRNCMLVGIDETFYDWIELLATFADFIECVPLPERLQKERFNLELVLRFILFRNIDIEVFSGVRSLGEFITEKMLSCVNDRQFDRVAEEKAFKTVFAALANALGDDSFRKYDEGQTRFKGAFLVSAFEIIAMGLGHEYIDKNILSNPEALCEAIIQKVWTGSGGVATKSGESAVARIPRTLELGRKLFR
jgi:hypothetical protein